MNTEYTKAQHTPGPWEVCDDEVNVYAPESDTAITNTLHPCAPGPDEQAANAALIAAAPYLLEALKELVGVEFRHTTKAEYGKQYAAAIAAARSAIAKAEAQ